MLGHFWKRFSGEKGLVAARRPPDYSSNLCPLKDICYRTFGGVFWASFLLFSYIRAKTPLKSHIANVLGGHRLDE